MNQGFDNDSDNNDDDDGDDDDVDDDEDDNNDNDNDDDNDDDDISLTLDQVFDNDSNNNDDDGADASLFLSITTTTIMTRLSYRWQSVADVSSSSSSLCIMVHPSPFFQPTPYFFLSERLQSAQLTIRPPRKFHQLT